MQHFLTQFFRGVFGRSTSSTVYFISVWSFVMLCRLCCVVLRLAVCCVVVFSLLCCDLLCVLFLSFPCCVALCCDLLLFPLDIFLLSFTFVPPQDGTTRPTDNGFTSMTSSTGQRHNFKHDFHRVFSTSKHFIFLFSFRNTDCIINFITDLSLFVGSDYLPSLTNQNVYCVTR